MAVRGGVEQEGPDAAVVAAFVVGGVLAGHAEAAMTAVGAKEVVVPVFSCRRGCRPSRHRGSHR